MQLISGPAPDIAVQEVDGLSIPKESELLAGVECGRSTSEKFFPQIGKVGRGRSGARGARAQKRKMNGVGQRIDDGDDQIGR